MNDENIPAKVRKQTGKIDFRPVDSPPPKGNRRGRQTLSERLADEIHHMKESPGKWFTLLSYVNSSSPASSASSAARALCKQVPGLEVVVRGHAVYGRWMGESEEHE